MTSKNKSNGDPAFEKDPFPPLTFGVSTPLAPPRFRPARMTQNSSFKKGRTEVKHPRPPLERAPTFTPKPSLERLRHPGSTLKITYPQEERKMRKTGVKTRLGTEDPQSHLLEGGPLSGVEPSLELPQHLHRLTPSSANKQGQGGGSIERSPNPPSGKVPSFRHRAPAPTPPRNCPTINQHPRNKGRKKEPRKPGEPSPSGRVPTFLRRAPAQTPPAPASL